MSDPFVSDIDIRLPPVCMSVLEPKVLQELNKLYTAIHILHKELTDAKARITALETP